MSYYDDDDDGEVTAVSRDDFQRALRQVRASAEESDPTVATREHLGQVLGKVNVNLSEAMLTSFFGMISAKTNAGNATEISADDIYDELTQAATGDYQGLPLITAIGGVVAEFKSSKRGRMMKHQQSVRKMEESASASRKATRIVEQRRIEELRERRAEQARLRAEQEAREQVIREEEAQREQARREEEARRELARREEEAHNERMRKEEEAQRRKKIRAARDRAASIDPTPRSPHRFDSEVRPEFQVRRRSSISKSHDDQLVTSVGPIRSSNTPSTTQTPTGRPKRLSNNLHSTPHVDPSNIPTFEEKEENEHPRKGTYDQSEPPRTGQGLVRSFTPPESDHLHGYQQYATSSSSHDRDEVPHRVERSGHPEQQPLGSHRRDSSRKSAHNRQNTATSATASATSATSASTSIAGANLSLNPAQMQTLHRVHAGLEYLQQMERDRWRQQNMLIDTLRDTESWKEISASVVESKLNALKKDLSEMFEAQSLASAHRVSSDLTRELRNVLYGINVLCEKIERNVPHRETMQNLLDRVTEWNQLLEERWAVLNVSKYSRARLSESHEEFRGEVLSSLDWVLNKSRETRRVVTDQLAGDIGNKVLQLLDAFKLTKDGHVKFEAGQTDEDDELVVPVSHVTGLIEKHQNQKNEEVSVLNQRISSLEDGIDEYEEKEKNWNRHFKNLRSENRDLTMETERLRARISVLEAEMETKQSIEKARKKASLDERQKDIQDSLDDREELLLEAESALHREQEVFDERFETWDSNREAFEAMVANHLENAKELRQNAQDYNQAIENESDIALSNWAFNNKMLQKSSRSADKRLAAQERLLRREFEVTLQRRLKQQYEKLRRAGRSRPDGDDMDDDDEKSAATETDGLAVETDDTGKVLSFGAERKKHKSELRALREQSKNWQRKALEVEQQLITARDTIIHLQKGIDSRNNVTTDMLKANVDLNVLTEQKKRLIKRLQTIYRTHLKHREQFDLDAMYKSRRTAELDRLRAEDDQNRQLLAEADDQLRRGLRFLDDPEQLTNNRHAGIGGILQLIHVDKYDMRNVCLMGARFMIGIFSQLYAVGHRTIDPKMLYNAYRIVSVSFDSFQAQKGNNMDEAVVTFGREAIEQYRWWRVWTHEWQKQTQFSQTFVGCLNRAKRNPIRAEDSFEPQTLEFNGQTELSFYRTRGMLFENRIIANSSQSRFYTGSRSSRRPRDKPRGHQRDGSTISGGPPSSAGDSRPTHSGGSSVSSAASLRATAE